MIRHHLKIPGSPMAHIELPRALEDYFAFAETTPTRNGRRFVLSLPYFCGSGAGAKLDRLQWWFHMSPSQELQFGEAAVATLRAQAIERFRRHIERWLENTRQRLHGEEPIPHLDRAHLGQAHLDEAHSNQPRIDPASVSVPAETASAASPAATAATPLAKQATAEVVQWPAERVANG
jgi:hypothetical protein